MLGCTAMRNKSVLIELVCMFTIADCQYYHRKKLNGGKNFNAILF